MKRAVVLLSGGLDSTTVAAVAKSEGYEIFALTIDYNQRHQIELESAKRVALALNVKQHVIFPLNLRFFGGSSLTGDLEVVKNVPVDAIGNSIPTSYVPARNIIFLSIALAYAETTHADKIYIGVSAIDYSGYPDCRPEFLTAFENMANISTKTGIEGNKISIAAPLVQLDKTATIKLGLSLGVDYSLTHTCYDPALDGTACGCCESCLLRLQAFANAGIDDPIKYARAVQ
ncbi:MAG: 7-cyano-7-deazaguanine synthase QueC [Planctomycetaceae bacterium]|jgi:7-cyano-7-deazaguanine synthase|nr:7-cyano-7-deazaguanine synthase QueC [Planctomycetaceae bacterium]